MSYEKTLEKVIIRLDVEEKEKDKRIIELEKERDELSARIKVYEGEMITLRLTNTVLVEEFAEAECLGEVAKLARFYGYEENDI